MIEYWVTNCFEFETGICSTLAPFMRSVDIHNGLELSQQPSLFHPGPALKSVDIHNGLELPIAAAIYTLTIRGIFKPSMEMH